jgi:hypothetical protein
MNRWILLSGLLCLWGIDPTYADTVFQSGPQRVFLLELYTSEGCSSCPPAESWLTQFRNDQRLWKQVVPVAFHVDYWDNLGWKDRFAKHGYTDRQQFYANAWDAPSVYTPEFVLNGTEWNGWFGGQVLPLPDDQLAGDLRVVLRAGQADVTFKPASSDENFDVHLAPLAMQVESDVRSGENRGRKLRHDFVVLDIISAKLTSAEGGQEARVSLSVSDAQGLAVWVTRQGFLTPLQAAGGFIR